jgi:uncharacterized protein
MSTTEKSREQALNFDPTEGVETLLKLQEINQNLDTLVEEIDKLKEEAAVEEKKYLAKQSQYEKHAPILQRSDKETSELKSELDDIRKRIQEHEEKKKKIKTIKEFKAINKEIDTLNKKNAIKENDLLTKTEELDFKKGKVEKIKESIDEIKAVIDVKKSDLDALIRERKDSISKYSKEKEKYESKLSGPMVSLFNRIYKHNFRMAVVAIENETCHGCYMKLPAQVEINVRKQESINFCPSCSRILYAGNKKSALKLSA